MSKITHTILITVYFAIIIFSTLFLIFYGKNYYIISEAERPFQQQYELLKPSGYFGHGLGIFGTLLILVGMIIYIIRKRWKKVAEIGRLKYWLEFHIFLCTIGTVFVIFHTTFKLGGIISVGFWVLILVWISGFIGRFIYLQIPRTIEGREMSLQELLLIKSQNNDRLTEKYGIDVSQINTSKISELSLKHLPKSVSDNEITILKKLIRKQRILVSRIERLGKIQSLFRAWHIIHLPFSVIMVVIMVIHVSVVLFFGYKWIF